MNNNIFKLGIHCLHKLLEMSVSDTLSNFEWLLDLWIDAKRSFILDSLNFAVWAQIWTCLLNEQISAKISVCIYMHIHIYIYIYMYIYTYIFQYQISCIKYGNIAMRIPPPHPPQCPPPTPPGPSADGPSMGWGGVGGNSIWVYFDIDSSILDIYIYREKEIERESEI